MLEADRTCQLVTRQTWKSAFRDCHFLSSTCRQSSLPLPQSKSKGNNFKIFRPLDVLLSAKGYLILQKVTIHRPFLPLLPWGIKWVGNDRRRARWSLWGLLFITSLTHGGHVNPGKLSLGRDSSPYLHSTYFQHKNFCKSLTGPQTLNLLYLAQMLTLGSAQVTSSFTWS